MASLTDPGIFGIFIFTLACGIAVKNLPGTGCAGTNRPADQFNIDPFTTGRIVTVIFNMCAMAICALNVLAFHIMVFFAGMATGTEVSAIWQTGSDCGTTELCAQQVTITTAQIGKIGAAVNGTAARIGKVNTMTSRA